MLIFFTVQIEWLKNANSIGIDLLPSNDRFMMMNTSRTDLASDEKILESPEWHKKALQETEQRFAEKKEKILDWQAVKKELRKHFDSVTGWMSDDRYNTLKKKYSALLEENESLRAKIRELESQQNTSTSLEAEPHQKENLKQKYEFDFCQESVDSSENNEIGSERTIN